MGSYSFKYYGGFRCIDIFQFNSEAVNDEASSSWKNTVKIKFQIKLKFLRKSPKARKIVSNLGKNEQSNVYKNNLSPYRQNGSDEVFQPRDNAFLFTETKCSVIL